jgi:hypothetical protein
MDMTEETPAVDPVFSRICESTTRLTAGVVPRPTMKELQKTAHAETAEYPWEAVVDRILRDPVDTGTLTQQALRAQRDWVVRGGREAPGRGAGSKAKSFVVRTSAKLLARLIFLAVLLPVVVLLLVLIKQKWPDLDIYRILLWMQDTWPTMFPK